VHALSSILILIVLCGTALACGALYLLPLLIGLARRVPGIGSVAAVNVLLGWTLAGWAAALAMALRSSRPAPPAMPTVRNVPHPRPWPDHEARAGWAGPPGPPPPRPGVAPPLALAPRAQASPYRTRRREHQ
jgi:Superinfection immunity protein